MQVVTSMTASTVTPNASPMDEEERRQATTNTHRIARAALMAGT